MCKNLDFFKSLFYKTKTYVSMCLIKFSETKRQSNFTPTKLKNNFITNPKSKCLQAPS